MWKKPIKIRYKLCAPRDPNLKHSEKHWYETLGNIIYYVCLCLYKPRKKERLHMWAGSCIRYRSFLEVQEGMCSDGVLCGRCEVCTILSYVVCYEWKSWLVGRACCVMSCARRTTEDEHNRSAITPVCVFIICDGTAISRRRDHRSTIIDPSVTMLCEGQL